MADSIEMRMDDPPRLVNAHWAAAFPWVAQGVTVRGEGDAPFDLGLFSGASSPEVVRRNWQELGEAEGAGGVIHAPQPHEATVRLHGAGLAGFHLVDACDGHVSDAPGLLMAVTVADCVPVFVVDPVRRAVGVIHAGWRGVASGILEEGLGRMQRAFGTVTDDVHVHLGPSICGECYEVGPEVFEAVGLAVPACPTPIDLRAVLGSRCAAAAVRPDRVSASAHCTLCGEVGLFSHRGGNAERQAAYIGVRT